LGAAVDALTDEVEAPRALTLLFEFGTQCVDELADVASDGLGRRNRFGEGAAYLYQFGRPDRLDRLSGVAEGLVEAPAQLGTEAQRQGVRAAAR